MTKKENRARKFVEKMDALRKQPPSETGVDKINSMQKSATTQEDERYDHDAEDQQPVSAHR